MSAIALPYISKPPSIRMAVFLILLAATVLGTHAVYVHGQEAVAARDCINRYGVKFYFVQLDGRIHQFCQDPQGNIFDQIVEKVNGKIEEVTAFKVNPYGAGNTWKNVYIWLARKGGVLFTKGVDGFVEVGLRCLLR